MGEVEIDFPRGKVDDFDRSSSTPIKKRRKDNDHHVKDYEKSSSKLNNDSDLINVKFEKITKDMLKDGALGLGIVREINDTDVILECANSLCVRLPANNISSLFLETLKNSAVTLVDVFELGQMIAFKVVDTPLEDEIRKTLKDSYPVVSCDPTVVNSHISPAELLNGLVINGMVESVEDKGVIINVGLKTLEQRGFLSKKYMPPTLHPDTLVKGQVILVRIQHENSNLLSETRVLQLSAVPELECLSTEISSRLKLNQLMPGTIMQANLVKSNNKGVFIDIGNGNIGFVGNKCLPARLHANSAKLKSFRIIIVFCQQNSKLLSLSAHPDIIAVSKNMKRTDFLGIQIGDLIQCKVKSNDKFGNVSFDLVIEGQENYSLITAFGSKKKLQEGKYGVGSIHQARVLSYRMMERCLVVANKKDILKQKIVGIKDAKPGEKLVAKIVTLKPTGLRVKIYDAIPGFIPRSYISDKLITHLSKHFTIGQSIACRVLSVNNSNSCLLLTSKESLLKSKHPLITNYENVDPGMITTGCIVYQHPNGGLIIGFFGGTRAFMSVKDASRLGAEIKVGQTIDVRVKSVDVNEERMLVGIANTAAFESHSTRLMRYAFVETSPLTFKAKVHDVASSGFGSSHKALELLIDFGEFGKKSTTVMPSHMFTDCLDPPFSSLDDCISSNAVIPKVVVLGEVDGKIKVSSKRFLINWLENHPRICSLSDLVKGQFVCGTIKQKHPEMGYFVELAGGSALNAPARFIGIELGDLQIGQTVLARISSLNVEKERFSLILDPSLCTPSEFEPSGFGVLLVRFALEDIEWLRKNNKERLKLPEIGDCELFVVSEVHSSISLKMAREPRVIAHLDMDNNFGLKEGDGIVALISSIKFPSCEVEIIPLKKTHESKFIRDHEKKVSDKLKDFVKDSTNVAVKICKVCQDYIVGVVTEDGNSYVTYIASRDHPNVIPNHDVVQNSTIHINPMEIVGNVIIGVKTELINKSYTTRPTITSKRSVAPLLKKKPKPFQIYPAKVVGLWKTSESSNCSIELRLPNDFIGRLHASELDEKYVNESSLPVKRFLQENMGKLVNVKVICISKLKKSLDENVETPKDRSCHDDKASRLAECTMIGWKMAETKKKQSLLGYPQQYSHGALINVFVKDSTGRGAIKVEASPLWNGVIRKQNLDEANLKSNPLDSSKELVDIEFEPGEKLVAQVIGISDVKKRRGKRCHRKCLELSLKKYKKEFEYGDCVTGRVISIEESPSFVTLELSNGQRAILSLTSITGNYLDVKDAFKTYEVNQLHKIHLLRFNSTLGRWYAVTEQRWDKSKKGSKKHSDFFKNSSEVKENSLLKAFVISSDVNGVVFGEISPGIAGRIENSSSVANLKLDDLIIVRVVRIYKDGGLKFLHMGSAIKNSEIDADDKSVRKRLLSIESCSSSNISRKKSRIAGYMASDIKHPSGLADAKVVDPGFDWSLEGFTPSEFANVGKIVSQTDSQPGNAAEQQQTKTINANVTNVDEISPSLNEKSEITMEKKLAEREMKILNDDWMPDSAVDFNRMVASTPNSSELWIRYISFFLEKNDIENARAMAERALSTINFREEDEIFNVWTAYLNLEANFGTAEALKEAFQRAIKNTDSLKMHKQMAKIYQNIGKNEELNNLLEEMMKRFRHDDLEVWYIRAQNLYEMKKVEEARQLMKKAIECLQKKHHVAVLCRFAQLEYKYGDVEQSKTIFESILNSYPKRTDVWTVYIDLLIKSNKIDDARSLFGRVTGTKLSSHKMRLFFKKWFSLEQNHGTKEQQNEVKKRLLQYSEDIAQIVEDL